jgi:hypothetical protein
VESGGNLSIFMKKVLPPSSGSESMRSIKKAEFCHELKADLIMRNPDRFTLNELSENKITIKLKKFLLKC